MDRIVFILPILLFLSSCKQPVDQLQTDMQDSNLIGIWYHDVTGDGDSPDDKRLIFGVDGTYSHANFVDPDGIGGQPYQWITVETPYTWSNGFFLDYSGNNSPNNLIFGDILLDSGSGELLFLFRYEYTNYPDELGISPGTIGFNGSWTHI